MPPYVRDPIIIEASRIELGYISEHLGPRKRGANPAAILIGGWAVDSFNPWYGSVDIDLIVDHDARASIQHHLVTTRGFVHERVDDVMRRIVKTVDGKKIILDLGSKATPDPFEVTGSHLDYSFLNTHNVRRSVAGYEMYLPTRAALLLMKMKAASDRGYRLSSGTSSDPQWESGKHMKDKGDILALLDPSHGGRDISLVEMAEFFNKFPFLTMVLESLADDGPAIEFYGRIDAGEVREIIETVLMQTT
ncbi:MAG: hypothetical protein A4E32_01200 [Methanomassiliicoccales archaeon PtaU1.Bin124]|nr:MAG: hypothetical protein A4E32_01200 [Methanomassiliicoccales archaeon PtaU1.Bin124]